MSGQTANARTISKQMFRLLPIQVLLSAVGAVNGIVSGYFASNYVGVDAMSAVGLYGPINMLVISLGMLMVSGSVIICGKYMGKNQPDKVQNVFSLNLLLSALVGAVFAVLLLTCGLFDLSGFLTKDPAVRPLLNRYLIGQAIGVFPLVLGTQLPAFLALENNNRRTMIASLLYIAVNIVLNLVFVRMLSLGAFGLALASSLGLWVFLAALAQYFFSKDSHLHISVAHPAWRESGEIFRIGFPGAACNLYQTARGLAVNRLLELFVGSVGISAFATADNVMRIFWAIPGGMLAVSRLMMSISIGEEDRRTLTDIMRVMFLRFVPLMMTVSALIMASAVPLTRIFFRDPAQAVYGMTIWGLRLLPLCMPFSVVCMHFTCYAQASDKQGLVHVLSLLDGVICVAGFTALLIRPLGMNSVYIANILNGVVCLLVILGYAVLKNRRWPQNMEELMVIPEDFGVPEEARMDLSVRSMEEVVSIAGQVQSFCLSRGVDERRACLAGLALEEMAGNVVTHGFEKDRKKHSVDVRVVHKGENVILRIKDDCIPFDPNERKSLFDAEDPVKNVGIRMVFRMASQVDYQYLVGLNVLTVRI